MVGVSVSSDSVFIRSWPYKYADIVHISDVGSVEMVSPEVVRISIPGGTMMGDHEILADLNTGIVSAETVVLLSNKFKEPKIYFDVGIEAKDYDRIKDWNKHN